MWCVCGMYGVCVMCVCMCVVCVVCVCGMCVWLASFSGHLSYRMAGNFGGLAVLSAIHQYYFRQNLCNHIVFLFNKAGRAMPID